MIRGSLGGDWSAKGLERLGECLGLEGKTALGYRGGVLAAQLARGLAKGIVQSGGTVLHHSLDTPAQSAWLGQSCQLPVSLFLEEREGEGRLYLFGRDGLAFSWAREEKLRRGLEGRGCIPGGAVPPGREEQLWLTAEHYCRDAVSRGRLRRRTGKALTLAVSGDSPEDRALIQTLGLLGCQVERQWRKGMVELGASKGGFALWAREEGGSLLEPEQLLPLLCLVELENGGGKIALPDQASAAADLVTAGFGAACLRPGRDGRRAWALYSDLPWLRDACFGAARLVSRLSMTGERLESLMDKTPRFATRKREVELKGDLGRVLAALAAGGQGELLGAGVRLRTGRGWVYLAPTRARQLRVVAESRDMELAAELCDLYAGRALRLDQTGEGEK